MPALRLTLHPSPEPVMLLEDVTALLEVFAPPANSGSQEHPLIYFSTLKSANIAQTE